MTVHDCPDCRCSETGEAFALRVRAKDKRLAEAKEGK